MKEYVTPTVEVINFVSEHIADEVIGDKSGAYTPPVEE